MPCHLICDDAFIVKYGLGMVRPRRMNLQRSVAEGYIIRADSLEKLAHAAHIDRLGLMQTVARHNGFAITGVDGRYTLRNVPSGTSTPIVRSWASR